MTGGGVHPEDESTNGWSGWFDGPSEQASGAVLEGVLEWDAEFGAMPESIFFTLGAYQTDNGGSL